MKPSISIVATVHNAEGVIAGHVHEMLEALSELAEPFEIILVDDGSTDQTCEVVREMARVYPQIQLERQPFRTGVESATQVGLAKARGWVVFVHDQRTPFRERELRRLWAMRHDERLVTIRSDQVARPLDGGLLQRLSAWGAAVEQCAREQDRNGGLQMIRRRPAVEGADAEPRPRRAPLLARLKELALGE